MYLFALFLVLYEFATYSANDMIMPGMIQVVNDFHAPLSYVALSLSFYILGNGIFLIIAGFLSERHGKRLIMLAGNLLFLIFTIVILFSHNIHQFILWRFFQGSGMSIIAIGYALIHEYFNDKNAIKLRCLDGQCELACAASWAINRQHHCEFIILAVYIHLNCDSRCYHVDWALFNNTKR